MKKVFLFLAIALVGGFTMTSCGNDDDGGDSNVALTGITVDPQTVT
jgi:hypothetical protein